MPCLHSIRQDASLVPGAASTSSRCEQTAPLQRVPRAKCSIRQLQRQLRRSRTAVRTAFKQCRVHTQGEASLVDRCCAAQLEWEQGQNGTRAFDSRCIGRCLLQGFAFAAMFSLLTPEASYAAESLPIGLVKSWLEQVESLGPVAGPLIFILTAASVEMVPLFPTQPVMLASGLLFGPVKGTVCVISGTALAAISAFSISRGVGRKLAEKVIAEELKAESSEGSVKMESKFQGIQDAIDQGSFAQQAIAVALLRLTPVVPFSASNYLLGMTPLKVPPFMTGTLAGMTVWGIVYASLGGASRSLLRSGMDLEELIADLGSKASHYTEDALRVAAFLGLAVAGYYSITVVKQRNKELAEAEALLREEQQIASRSAVRRVRKLVQRLRGNA